MGAINFFFSLNVASTSQGGILSPALDFRSSDNSQYVALL